MKWHEMTPQQAAKALETDCKNGLSEQDILDRLDIHGPNKLAEKKKTSIIIRFLMQFNDFMVLILLAAATISFVVSYMEGERDFADPLIILAIVSLNAVLGLIQENKAEKAIEALKKMSSPAAKVLRNGHFEHTSTENLVPGDIILLETGDMVPADARLLTAHNLRAEESALTGESLPVEKDSDVLLVGDIPTGDKKNMVFAGSSINYGRGTAIVAETGMHTEVGKIAAMIMTEEDMETPLQVKLADIGKKLGIGALIICAVIFIMGIMRQIPPFGMFMTSVSLAVAAIPEGLPAIVTIMLAIGVQRMARRNAVIRKLPAVETLGSADVICSDKTGTLTQNKMRVVEVSDGFSDMLPGNPAMHYILSLGSLCNDCVLEPSSQDGDFSVIGDPTEAAIAIAYTAEGQNREKLKHTYERVGEIPFDSKRKLMTTLHKHNGGYMLVTKGAPDVLLPRCNQYTEHGKPQPMTPGKREQIARSNGLMADKALRVLGVAYAYLDKHPGHMKSETIEKNLVFAGLIGMIDPPRPEVPAAVKTCIEAGIKPVMVTGDHVATATAIAKKIGIMSPGDRAITGEELNRTSQEQLEQDIDRYSVFARVSPEHKMRIVKAFQARGNVVAMTGDGVNDAPALKAADIGCAMGISGTDVAKGAADMVLTDDNFATIVDAAREGRGIYSNIRKAVHFLLSSNIGEILTIFVSILLGWHTPLLAIHLLWVNLVTDSLPAIALGLDPASDDVMKRREYDNKKGLFSGGLWQQIILEGCMIGLLALVAFSIGMIYFDAPGSVSIGRTMAFATLSISQLVHAFNMRSNHSIFSINPFGNLYLVGALIIGVILQASVIMVTPLAAIFKVTPLHWTAWLVVAILCLMPVVIVELEKLTSFREKAPRKTAGRRFSISRSR